MKYALFATIASALALAGCKVENPGLHLGQFKTECAEKGGTITEVESNKLKCTLPDGSETFSK